MEEMIEKLWGFEVILVSTPLYAAKEIHLVEGAQCSLHYHKVKDETFIVMEGEVTIELEDEVHHLTTDDSLHIKPYQKHRFYATTPTAMMLEVSTEDMMEDSYREEDSCYR